MTLCRIGQAEYRSKERKRVIAASTVQYRTGQATEQYKTIQNIIHEKHNRAANKTEQCNTKQNRTVQYKTKHRETGVKLVAGGGQWCEGRSCG
jgi:hypothetical protein